MADFLHRRANPPCPTEAGAPNRRTSETARAGLPRRGHVHRNHAGEQWQKAPPSIASVQTETLAVFHELLRFEAADDLRFQFREAEDAAQIVALGLQHPHHMHVTLPLTKLASKHRTTRRGQRSQCVRVARSPAPVTLRSADIWPSQLRQNDREPLGCWCRRRALRLRLLQQPSTGRPSMARSDGKVCSNRRVQRSQFVAPPC